MTEMTKSEILVDSIHIAAFLNIHNIPILRIERSGRMGVFAFPRDKAEELINRYMAGEAMVEPRAFTSAIREVRRFVDEAINESKYRTGSPRSGL